MSEEVNQELLRAVRMGKADTVQRLIKEKKANPNVSIHKELSRDGNYSLLHFAAEKGFTKVLQALLDAGAKQEVLLGTTPLHLAVTHGHISIIEALLAAKAEVNIRDSNQRSALHIAATKKGGSYVVDLLIDAKASINAFDREKNTPLLQAAFSGNLPIVSALLAAKADVAASNKEGSTPLIAAMKRNHSAIAQMLRKAKPEGATPPQGMFSGCDRALSRVKQGLSSFFMEDASNPSQVKLPKPTPVIALKSPEKPPTKMTEGYGNCAFHAVFGVPAAGSGYIFDAEHLEHREQLRLAILSTTAAENPGRYQVIQSCILTLLYEALINPGIFAHSPNLAQLLESYQANTAVEVEVEQNFRQAVLANRRVFSFINQCCKDYISPSGKKLVTFTDKYSHMQNYFKGEFEKLLETEGLLSQYTAYQTSSLRDFSSNISASHIEEYAKILGRPGQNLLAHEMSLLAQVFNKTITYYSGIAGTGGMTLAPVVLNAGCADVVAVRHNGIDHFERVDEGYEWRPRLDSKMSKTGFFAAVPVASTDLAESSRSASSGKRKREDSDVVAQGKQHKVDSSRIGGSNKPA